MALDRLFIPRDAAAGPIGNNEMAGLELERLGQDGIRPVLPLEPVRRFGDPHEMRRDFRIEVGRHFDAGRAGDGGGAQPAGHAADPHQVGHHVFAGAGLDRLEQRDLVTRDRTKEDRRVVVHRLTKAGTELVNELDRPMDALQKKCFGHLKPDKLRDLVNLLEEVRSGL